jgi:hypothetical protein
VEEDQDWWKLLRRSADVPEYSNPWDTWRHRVRRRKPSLILERSRTLARPLDGDDADAWSDRSGPLPLHGMKLPCLFQCMLPP